MDATEHDRATFRWDLIRPALRRPYRVPAAMLLLAALVPLYVLLPELWPPERRYVPELSIDRVFPLVPAWSLVYGALYLFLILLPLFVVREDEHVRRTVSAYLFIWMTAYLFFFVLYPTAAPRPSTVRGEGFAVWGLRALYAADPPYNCFPSLHVAHAFVSAAAAAGVHRRLGMLATFCAVLVALSTLFTKQHYVADVVAGMCLAGMAWGLFLRRYPGSRVPALDRDVAPAMAACVACVVLLATAGYWVVYASTGAHRSSP